LTGTGSPAGPWTIALTGANITANGLTLSYANGQYSLGVSGSYPVDYQVNLGYDGNYTYHDVFNFGAQLSTSGPAPNGGATNGPDTITAGPGSTTIDGAGGIDTVVFGDVRADYTVTQTPGTATWTVTHNTPGGEGTDTLVNVERLTFADAKVAIDTGVLDHGGEAYRLYQAAFNRVPDIGGLGFQINALDSGLSLEQVAGNFIASPEFQTTYGSAIDNTAFLTLLYQNVLHRAPDPGGLQFHLDEMAAGQTRIDELIHFSQSPENQANVAGAIADGMMFVFP
jgi:serralysin